jgi:hypothetical protein
MTASPISSAPVALLSAVPSLEKRVISSPGARSTVSNFEQLLRATPGSRPSSTVAKPQVGNQVQAAAADTMEFELPGTESLGLALSPPRLVGKNGDDTDLLIVDPQVCSAALPWPAHSDVEVMQGRPGISTAIPLVDRFAGALANPVSAAASDMTAAFDLRGLAPTVLPTLPDVPLPSVAPASADQFLLRSFADVFLKATNVPPGNVVSGSSTVDGLQSSKVVAPSVRWVPVSLASVPAGTEPLVTLLAPTRARLSDPGEATGPRLSAEFRAVDSAAVVLAQFGVVRVVGLDEIEHAHDKGSASLSEAYPRADALGTWVPELGGLVSTAEGPLEPVGFAHQLAEQVDTWVAQNLHVAEIRLQEPNSNPVLVRIEMTGQQANVIFRTDVPACREALASQLDQLSDLLSAQGLQLGGASVGGSGADASSRREAAPLGWSGWPALTCSAPEAAAMTQSPIQQARGGGGRALDVFV